MKLNSKLPKVGTTIFSVMSKLANECGAINLSQGFPGFPVDSKITAFVDKFMKEGYNQYAPMPGVPVLREQIAKKTNLLYNYLPNTETEICVTSGATEALFAAITAVVQPGDEVIIFEPAYDSYIPAIELCGGIVVPIELKYPNYNIDWNEVEDKVSEKTRLIITNTPHNPTGAVWASSDIDSLKNIVRNTNIVVISDEVYEHITFDETPHQSVILDEELLERSMVISSFGKTFHTTGWKIGYCVAKPALMNEFKKVHQFLTFSSSTPFQYAIAEYMKDESNYLHLPSFFQQKRDFFREHLKNTKLEILPCKGTYFQLASYKNISDESDIDFAKRITKEYGVASIPVSVFYNSQRDDKVLRFCFAKQSAELSKACENLSKL